MSSAILAKILAILVLVINVMGEGLQCNWVCDVNVKEVARRRGEIGANFKLTRRVTPNCTDGTNVNSSNLIITVGILVAHDVDNPNEYSFSDFWTLGIKYVSPRLSPRHLLFGNEDTDLESINGTVSCLLQPTPNETGRVASNGLDALSSPLFYLRNNVENSQKTPYLGYVEIGGRFNICAGFTNSISPEYRLTFDQWHLNLIRMLNTLLVVLFTSFIPSILMLFYPSIKIQTECLSRPIFSTEEGEANNSRRTAIEHGELEGAVGNDHVISQERAVQCAQGISQSLPSQECNSAHNGRHEMAGLLRMQAAAEVNPSAGHRAGGRSSAMGQSSVRATNKPDTPQLSGVPHENYKNIVTLSLLGDEVMDGGSASPVGLRSFIANEVFLKSRSRSLSLGLNRLYEFVMFLILIIFPQVFAYCIDVFVLVIPRLFPRIASKLPSPFLTKFVFFFTYEVWPGFMYVCLLGYIIRTCCSCSRQSSSSWVPSLFNRKHCFCLWKNNCIYDFVFLNSSWPVCDECKKAPEVELPVNIKNNLVYIFSLEMWLEKGKFICHVYQKFKEWWAQQQNEEASITWAPIYEGYRTLGKWILFLCFLLGLVILFFLLLAMYVIAYLPATSLCYGRVWFTLNWTERCVKNRYWQFCSLIGEFLVIFFSIVWIVYFSFCCSLSMALALLTFYIVGVNYPAEMILSAACYIMVGLLFGWCYRSSLTGVYENLRQKLIKTCTKDHASVLSRYNEGGVINIPLKLFTSARVKLKPIGDSVQNLFFQFIVLVFILVLIFSIAMGSNTDIPAKGVLGATLSLLVVIWAVLSYFGLMQGNDENFEGRVRGHVDAILKGKLD